MSMRIRSIATVVPPHRIAQTEAAAVARRTCVASHDEQARIDQFYRHSGVQTRHSVLLDSHEDGHPDFYPPSLMCDDRGPSTALRQERFEREAPALATAAARQALDLAQINAAEITHVVSASCTGFHAPGFDIALIAALGLPATVARTHIGFMGCHAALNALRVAHGFTASQPSARVLLIAVELCSLHYQYGTQTDRVIANALFADGAAALIGVGRDLDTPRTTTATTLDPSPLSDWSLRASGSTIVPDTLDAMRWLVRDHGFEMTLSPQVPDLIVRHLREWLDAWLSGLGLSVVDIPTWAIHPGGPKILAACARACGLSRDQLQPSLDVLAEFGNMSSPTVLFILERLRHQRATGPCVALAFGPGLTIEAALLDAVSP